MAFDLAAWNSRKHNRQFIIVLPLRGLATILQVVFVTLLTVAYTVLFAPGAYADRSALRIYDAAQGLASVGGACMVQDRAGYMLVCTEHGVFAYDGRRFVNLGTTQGLRQGGFVYNIALTSSGRVAVGFADEVLISDTPSDPARPPSSLTFHAAEHPGVTFFDQRVHRLASWH